ncbi:MAG: trans-sulfuration enzyme family protein [Thermoplasmatota archaeon]
MDATDAVHGGERPDPIHGAANQEIVHSTTYRYPERRDGSHAPYIYTRYDNPTVEALEAKLAQLEHADGALAFASGMAAIQAVCQAFCKPGDTLAVMRGVYGGTMAYLREELEPMGVHVHVFDADGPRSVPDGTTVVWMESITNPLLRVPDVKAWAEVAREVGARLCVDATFATPVLQRPLDLGAHIVVHSGTKYLGGHTDVMSGFIVHRQQDRDALWTTRRNLGAVLDPLAAYLVARGMKTLPLRMAAHGANANMIAKALEGHPKIKAVHHATLPAGPCGMVTLDLGSEESAIAFRRATRLLTPAASLGGVESLVSLPIETSHAYATDAQRAAEGITSGLVRISVGIEDGADLLADIEQALGQCP